MNGAKMYYIIENYRFLKIFNCNLYKTLMKVVLPVLNVLIYISFFCAGQLLLCSDQQNNQLKSLLHIYD